MASDSVIQAPSDGGDVASQIPFHDLCALMEKIHKTQGTDKKKTILSSFIERWRETHARLHHTDATDTFFAIMRLLLSELDRAIPAYGMKETALAMHYIEEAGDFADVAYFVLKSRFWEPHGCSVPGRPSQWQHQQGQGWHEEGLPAPPEEHQCSGAEVAHQDHTEGSCSCGGEGNPEGTKDLVFNPFISGSTCACYSSIPT
ncbi:hypothetical protein EMCRGX_G013091 [Ephydatia muelleri]